MENIKNIHFCIQQTLLVFYYNGFYDVQISGAKTDLIEPSPLMKFKIYEKRAFLILFKALVTGNEMSGSMTV